jgi:hypothetical protein
MHDIDRVMLEAPAELQEDEDEDEQFFEDEDEQFFEQEDEFGNEHEHSLSEAQEIELANHVLEVGSPQELEQFVGDLLTAAADSAGRFARSKTGRQLGGILKQAAAQAVPAVSGALGAGEGETNGRPLGAAARLFGVQQENMTNEDKEFELARHFVRFADCATRQAVKRMNSAPPSQVARRAVTKAARRHAPGLPLQRILSAPPSRRVAMTSAPRSVSPRRRGVPSGANRIGSHAGATCRACGTPLTASSGRWVVRGNTVVLLAD